jgi:hypothetical protein
MTRFPALVLTALLLATPVLATTFIVPEDAELISKSDAIVIGTIDRRSVQESQLGLETVYELRVSRVLKGITRPLQTLTIFSAGGTLGNRGLIVFGEAHFAPGDRVLLFLTRDRGRWTVTDGLLGKFAFKTATSGAHLLVRSFDYTERMRREDEFVRFIEERVAGRRPDASYYSASSEVIIESSMPENPMEIQPNAPAYPAPTYTDHRTLNGTWLPSRWENMAAGAVFYKRSGFDIPGAADGGVSVIQNGMAAWNNECGSVINLVYGGQRSTASAGQDAISMIEFNDPQGRLAGSWTGSGRVADTFLTYWNPHQFPTGTTWWSIYDADIVFQDGYAATNASFPTSMTHELGHGIGWRHSNAHYIRTTGNDEPCNSSIEECSSSAIMNAGSTGAGFGYTLQPWDINASQAVYPGGNCGTGSLIFEDGFEQVQTLPGRWGGKAP